MADTTPSADKYHFETELAQGKMRFLDFQQSRRVLLVRTPVLVEPDDEINEPRGGHRREALGQVQPISGVEFDVDGVPTLGEHPGQDAVNSPVVSSGSSPRFRPDAAKMPVTIRL